MLSSMEATKLEERSAGQTLSLFGTSDVENQRITAERRKKRIYYSKIIIGVGSLALILLCPDWKAPLGFRPYCKQHLKVTAPSVKYHTLYESNKTNSYRAN